jgi:hypothetical protein
MFEPVGTPFNVKVPLTPVFTETKGSPAAVEPHKSQVAERIEKGNSPGSEGLFGI